MPRTSSRRAALLAAVLALLGSLFLVAGPAPVASAAAALSCDGLLPGTYTPAAGTTGVKTGSALTVIDQPGTEVWTITSPITIENADIRDAIRLKTGGVVIRNSVVKGGPTPPATDTALINAWEAENTGAGLVLEGVKLEPQAPSVNWNGVKGHDYTAKCVDVSEVTDGFQGYNTHAPTSTNMNINVQQTYCHELAAWALDSAPDKITHNDCFQGQGARGVTMRYNHFSVYISQTVGDIATDGYLGCSTCTPVIPADPNRKTTHPEALSGIMVNELNLTVGGVRTTYAPANWTVESNRFAGAEVQINAGDDGLPAGTNLGTICKNLHEKNTRWGTGGATGQGDAAIWVGAQVTVNTCDTSPYRANAFVTPVTVKRNA